MVSNLAALRTNVSRFEFDLIGAFHRDEGGVSPAATAALAAPVRRIHSPQVTTRRCVIRQQQVDGSLLHPLPFSLALLSLSLSLSAFPRSRSRRRPPSGELFPAFPLISDGVTV